MWYLICFIVGLAVGGVGVWYFGIKRKVQDKVLEEVNKVIK